MLDTDGAARSVAEFAAADDNLAVRLSEDAAAGQSAELWRGDLLVASLTPLDAASRG
jgi:hypothetical protein